MWNFDTQPPKCYTVHTVLACLVLNKNLMIQIVKQLPVKASTRLVNNVAMVMHTIQARRSCTHTVPSEYALVAESDHPARYLDMHLTWCRRRGGGGGGGNCGYVQNKLVHDKTMDCERH